MIELAENLLNVTQNITEKNSGEFMHGLPDTIVLHYTGEGSAATSVRTFIDPKVKASAHLVVGRDGDITQLVPFNKIAWHSGKSVWGNRKGMNNYSIGIELDNAGVLTKVGNHYQSWFEREYPESDVIKAVHRNEVKARYWHKYTVEQIQTAFDVCVLLMGEYDIKEILGHEEISEGRKLDPGPAFPLDKFRQRLLFIDQTIGIPKLGVVVAKELAVHAEPDVKAEKLNIQLSENTNVEILDKKGDWYKVNVEIEGWVSAKHIKISKVNMNW